MRINLGITFCSHSTEKLVARYAEANAIKEKKVLDRLLRIWHQDRYVQRGERVGKYLDTYLVYEEMAKICERPQGLEASRVGVRSVEAAEMNVSHGRLVCASRFQI